MTGVVLFQPLRALSLAGACAAALASCGPSLPAPGLEAMAPDWGYNGEETAVLIEGDGFYPHVTATGANDFTWDRQYRAWLEGQASLELDGVSIASYSELEGRVPAGLAPGLYDLRLRSPSGEEVVLADAFTATDTRADHFETEDVDLSHAVNERVIVEVFVVDPEGDPVASAEEITVLVEADDPSGVSFPTDLTLDQQESLGDDEVGVTGSLGEDGRGLFTITSSVPDLLTLWITSADAGSPLTGTAILLDFSAGNVANVEIELPNTDGLTAGDTFDVSIRLTDIDGNATRGVAASLLLYEACPRGSWQQAVQIIDRELAVPVMVTAATTTDCPANAIQAIGVSAGTEISGSSETFDVAPGDAESLAVIASPSEITAGIDPLDVWVWAVDAWGNELSAYDADLTLYDSLGGLDPDATIGFQSCTAFSTGLSVAVCEASLWKAGEGVTLRAVASDGVEGESNPFDVLAGDVSSLEVEVSDDEVVAGVSFTAALHVEDSFGNLVEADLSTTDPVWLDVDATGVDRGVTCTIDDDASGGGTSLFDCVAETAGTGHSLRVSLSLGGETLYANSTLYDVINGELDQVEVSLPYDSLRAGNAITVALTGTDAYGNPYVTGSDMDVKLDDETGTLALETGGAATVTLSGGEGSAAVVITAAIADDRITASQSGADLGTSEAFDVLPAEVQHLQVSPAATWAWLDTGVAVALEAHDIYENIVTTYDETVTLSSSEGLGSDHEVTSWVDGAAEIVYAFDSTGFGDLLVAIGEDGTSGDADVEVDVLDGDCSAGPTARLRVAGSSPATLCLSSGSTPASWISASRSTAGAATIRVFHFDDGSGEWARSTTSDLLRSWTEEGGWPIRVVVADEAGCADETSTAVYVAESDGRPAGPMLVSLADSTLNTGTDSTLVEVQASDCSGDPADGTLYVRADLGAIEATASGDVEETDEGLAFEVSGGTGELSWSVVDERFDGTATLHVGALTGAAYGSATATVSGDSARPIVLDVSPAGAWTGDLSSVVVSFSEPMSPSSLGASAGNVALLDGGGDALSIDEIILDDEGDAVEVFLSETAPADTWRLTVETGARDLSGNRLDGLYEDSASTFTLSFGDVSAAEIDVSGCEPDTTVIRPDGADGSGEEADELTLSLTAGSAPVWWRLVVTDDAGDIVRVRRLAAETALDEVSWDGRGQDGLVVENGEYSVSVRAEDAYWSAGASCEVSVAVDNRVIGVDE